MGAVASLVVGLVALVAGAEVLVRNGSRLASQVGIPPLVVGLTIVAIGTSTPELAIGIDAATAGNGSLAIANIAGTNTVNILLILGLSAAMVPLAVDLRSLRLSLPATVAASLALVAMAWDGRLSQGEAAVLVVAGLAYTTLVVLVARQESRAVKAQFDEEFGVRPRDREPRLLALHLAGLLGGIAVIVVGADWLVDGAVELAGRLGVSEAFIGLTVVAVGTSAPELATTIRGQRDIAVGNLLGSSTYNILIILGVTGLVPAGGILFDRGLIRVDIPIMAAASLILAPTFLTGHRMSRLEGSLFVTGYLAYVAYLLLART